MTEEMKAKRQKILNIVSISMLIAIIGVMVLLVMNGYGETIWFPVTIGGLLFLFWICADVLNIVWAKEFDGRTEEQKNAYYKFAVIDLIGLAGLLFFLVNMQSLTGALIYAGSMIVKRKFRDIYNGVTHDDDAQDDTQDDAQDVIDAQDIREVQDDEEAPKAIAQTENDAEASSQMEE